MLQLKIQDLARERGYSIEHLSRETGLGVPTVRRYWNNRVRRVRLPILAAISATLNVEVSELFKKTE